MGTLLCTRSPWAPQLSPPPHAPPPWGHPHPDAAPHAGVLREVSTDFTVDARALTKTGGPHVKARVLNPSGAKTETYITDHGDGTYRVDYTPYEDGEGPHGPHIPLGTPPLPQIPIGNVPNAPNLGPQLGTPTPPSHG